MIIDSPIISGSYAASGSLNQVGSVTITGSLTVTGDITGNITGSATNAVSASFAANANSASFAATASFALNVPQTSSFAISASNARTASFAPLYLPLAGGTMTGDISAAGRTFTYQYLVLGSGTTEGRISTDGGKPIRIFPTSGVESARFLANGNVIIQNGGTYTDNGFRLDVSGSGRYTNGLTVTGSINVSGSVTGSLLGTASFANNTTSASYAATASYLSNYIPPFPFTGSAGISGSLVVNGNITAQTLIVQTVTSSVDFVTGSTRFGSIVSNTHQFTGSVTMSGSLAVSGPSSATLFMNPQTLGDNVVIPSGYNALVLGPVDMSSSIEVGSGSNLIILENFTNLATTGSNNFTGNQTITGSLNVTQGITGSLLGTASFANTSTSSSFATTASFSLNVPVTSSYANNATSASFATTASYLTGYISPFPYTGSAIISGSLEVTGSAAVSNLQGTGVRYLVADASGSITAQSASAALKATQEFTSTAGQTTFSVTNGYATGYVDVFINGSKLSTAEFTDTSGTNIVLATGSFDGDIVEVVKYTPAAGVTNNVLRQLTTLTGSAGQTVFSASYTPGLLDIFYNGSRLSTSDYTANNGTYFTLATASVADDILDVLVYSYQVGAFNGIGGQGVVNQLAFFNTTSSITGSNSFAVSGNTLVGTASYTLNADTLDGAHLSILATTGSNTFTSAQYISNTSAPIGFTDTASLYTDGGLRATKTSYFSSSVYIGGDLVIFGTQSVNYITSSQLNIADNVITVNTSSPAVRFGGIAVQDSGSLATGLTGSLLWDSQNNHWIYSNPSGSSYSGGMLISGPRASSLGEEQGTTNNALMKGQGGDHITSSAVFEVSGSVGIGTSSPGYNLEINSGSSSPTELAVVNTNAAGAARLSLRNTERDFIITSNTADDLLSFAYGGSNRLQFHTSSQWFNSGNVGIGTTSPTSLLEVQANQNAQTGIRVRNSTSGTSAGVEFGAYTNSGNGGFGKYSTGNSPYKNISAGSTYIYNGASGDIALLNDVAAGNISFAAGGVSTAQMFISASGNVGIGVTNPSYKLDIRNDIPASTSLDPITLRLYNNSDGGSAIYFSNGVGGQSKLSFGVESTGAGTDDTYLGFSVGANTALSERMRITSGGSVGIGTTGPETKLHIEGSTAIGTTGTESILLLGRAIGAGASFQQAAALKLGRYQNAGGSFESYTRLDFALRDNSASSNYNTNTTVMTLTNASRVGIGVTNPDAGLQIAAPAQDDQLTLGSAANNRDHAAFIYSGGNKAEFLRYQSGVRLIFGSSANISNIDVLPGGTNGVRLSAGNTSWSAYTSDERKKKNFETVPGLEALLQINPVKYHFKTQDDSETKKLGFIAQNIQPLIPEMVHPNGEKAEDETDILTIIPDYILPVLVKAIQEQQALITALQEKLERNNIN
jgi:hypothetical protein